MSEDCGLSEERRQKHIDRIVDELMPTLDGVMREAIREATEALRKEVEQAHGVAQACEQRAEQAEREVVRLRAERAAALNVKTKEGLTASEWLLRTGLAEHRAERAELENEKLLSLVDDYKSSALLSIQGDPDRITPQHIEQHITDLRGEVERLRDRLKQAGSALEKAEERAAALLWYSTLHPTGRTLSARRDYERAAIAAYRAARKEKP